MVKSILTMKSIFAQRENWDQIKRATYFILRGVNSLKEVELKERKEKNASFIQKFFPIGQEFLYMKKSRIAHFPRMGFKGLQ